MNAPKLNLSMLKNIDFTQLTAIAKQRGVLIGSVLVIVIAPLAAWWFRSGLTDKIEETMSQRVKDFAKMSELSQTEVKVRGATVAQDTTSKVSLNGILIQALQDRNLALENELKDVYQAAIEYNQKHHSFIALKDNQGNDKIIFPKPDQNDVIEEIYFPAIIPAYQALLVDNRTGQAPDSAAVLEAVQRRSSDFILSDLKKKSITEVTDPKELSDLTAALRGARLASLDAKAREISVYLDSSAIVMPQIKEKITPADCFILQWDLWVLQDIFSAIAAGNAGVTDGVISAPVKRIISIAIDPLVLKALATDASAEKPAADPAQSAAEPAKEEEATGEAIMPGTEIAPDYATSMTGLKSCQLYDVRNVKLKLIVATEDMPKVFNAFAQENFMTITQVKMSPVDVFAAARQGYIYGKEPCSEVDMTLETIWFRAWTTLQMPIELKNKLGTRGVDMPVKNNSEQPADQPKDQPKDAASEDSKS